MKQLFGWRALVGVAASAGALLMALAAPGLAAVSSGVSSTARTAGWTVTVLVARTTVKAGTAIPATITIDNHSGHAVRIGECPGTYDLMNLGNAKIPNSIVVPTPACSENSIAPGVHVVHTKVWTTFEGCTKSTPSHDLPRCPKSGTSVPLPVGNYRTNIVLPSIKGLPTPKPITVRLTA